MIGHRQVVDARANRQKPAAIVFDMDQVPVMPRTPCTPGWKSLRDATYGPEHALDADLFPTVYEALPTDDLRFALGCQCHVIGSAWTQRLIGLGHALADAGASMVVVSAIAESPDLMVFERNEWKGSCACG